MKRLFLLTIFLVLLVPITLGYYTLGNKSVDDGIWGAMDLYGGLNELGDLFYSGGCVGFSCLGVDQPLHNIILYPIYPNVLNAPFINTNLTINFSFIDEDSFVNCSFDINSSLLFLNNLTNNATYNYTINFTPSQSGNYTYNLKCWSNTNDTIINTLNYYFGYDIDPPHFDSYKTNIGDNFSNCYQEFTNKTDNGCGLNSGSYTLNGVFNNTYVGGLAIDGDWTTYASIAANCSSGSTTFEPFQYKNVLSDQCEGMRDGFLVRGQSFTANSTNFTYINQSFNRNGASDETIWWDLYDSDGTGGLPGTLLQAHVCGGIDLSQLKAGEDWNAVKCQNTVTLAIGHRYWITIPVEASWVGGNEPCLSSYWNGGTGFGGNEYNCLFECDTFPGDLRYQGGNWKMELINNGTASPVSIVTIYSYRVLDRDTFKDVQSTYLPIAQQFIANTTSITIINLTLWLSGSPTGAINFHLYSDSGSNTLGDRLLTDVAVFPDVSILTATETYYTIPTTITGLTVGTKYWLVMNHTGSVWDGSNRPNIYTRDLALPIPLYQLRNGGYSTTSNWNMELYYNGTSPQTTCDTNIVSTYTIPNKAVSAVLKIKTGGNPSLIEFLNYTDLVWSNWTSVSCSNNCTYNVPYEAIKGNILRTRITLSGGSSIYEEGITWQYDTGISPTIGSNVTINMTLSDLVNISYCKLAVNDTGIWENKTVYTINNPNNYILDAGYIIQDYSTANISWLGLKIWCNDSLGQENTSEIITFKVKDTTIPNITFDISGNNWGTDNLTIITPRYNNLTYNVTFFDYNLFQMEVNASCELNGTIYFWEILNYKSISYNNYSSINISNLPMQKCKLHFGSTDAHTANDIGTYIQNDLSDGIEFNTYDDTKVQIRSEDENYKNVNTEKQIDRYKFNFEFNNKELTRTFKVTSNYKIYYRDNSIYPAHFVVWDGEKGTWIDFNMPNKDDFNYIVTENSDYDYTVEIQSKQLNNLEELKTIEVEKLNNNLKHKLLGGEVTDSMALQAVKEKYGIDRMAFTSIGGTNPTSLDYEFAIGGEYNFSVFNLYDNGTIMTGYTLNITTIDAAIDFNKTVTIPAGNYYNLTNITNGTYRFDFIKPQWFNRTAFFTLSTSDNKLNMTSFQSVVNLIFKVVKSNEILTNSTVIIHNMANDVNSSVINSTNLTTFYVNASQYTVTAIHPGIYNDTTNNFSIDYEQNLTLIIPVYYLAHFNLFDEKTLLPFNVSAASEIQFFLFCPGETQQFMMNKTSEDIPILCDFDRLKIILYYETTNYYRTFLITQQESLNFSIYLIDLTTTQSLSNSFRLDDLMNDYDNPSIYVTKFIGTTTQQITADYVDIEKKIVAYLIQNNEYDIEVHSENHPIRYMGKYSADIAGDKILRLYDIGINPTLEGFDNSVTFSLGFYNKTSSPGISTATLLYNDSENFTSSVIWNLNQDSSNGTLLYTQTFTNNPNIEAQYSSAIMDNKNIISSITINRGSETKIYGKQVQTVLNTALADIKNIVGADILSWFIIILLTVVAMYATIRSSNIAALVIVAITGVSMGFGWIGGAGSGLTWTVFGAIAVVNILAFLKEVDKREP